MRGLDTTLVSASLLAGGEREQGEDGILTPLLLTHHMR